MTSTAIDRALAKFQMSYTFDESKVARDEDGRFTSKGGSGGAPSFRTPPLREPSPGPGIERRSLTRGESWQRTGAKIGDFPKEYVEDAPTRLPEAVTGVDWEARLAALKERRAGRDRVYATREAPVDWFAAPPKVAWQVPPDMPVEMHIETVGALKRVISGTRQDAIAKARETRQKVAVHGIKDRFTAKRRTGDLILPEDTPAGAANRAYNHAAMLALHDFGVLDYDFQMSDAQKEELTPLIPFMRYVRRRLGAEMRSGHLKGATTPYRAAFGQPFKDERRHKVTGDVRLRVRPNDVLVKRMDIEARLRRLEARRDPDGIETRPGGSRISRFAAAWAARPRYITRDELHAIASEAADPTPAQAEAGNYRMGHVKIGGLPFAIETPMGRERRGVSPDGEEWVVTMPAHYGYVKGTEGADEDPVDVYLGPLAHEADLHPVFVVDQVDPETGDFDEHKAMLGFSSRPEAVRTYDAGFSDGRGPERRDTVTALTWDEFKDWLGEGDTMAPMGKAAPRGCADERVATMMEDADRILAQAGAKKRSRWRGVVDPDVEAVMPDVDRLVGRPRPPETPARRMARSKMIGDPRVPLATVLGKAFDEAKVARDEDGKFASKGRGRFSAPLYDDLYAGDLMLGGIVGAGTATAALTGTYAAMNAIKSRKITPAAMARKGKKSAHAKMAQAREGARLEMRGRPEELAQAAHRKVMEEARNRGGDMAEAARDAERMAERVRRLKQRSESSQSAAARFQGWLKGQRAALNAMKDLRPKWRADAAAARRSNRVPGGGKAALVAAIAGATGGGLLTDRSYQYSRHLSGGGSDERSAAVIAGDVTRIVPGAVMGGVAGAAGGWHLAERFRLMNKPLRVKVPVVAVPVVLGAAIGGGLRAYGLASERSEARRLAREGGA